MNRKTQSNRGNSGDGITDVELIQKARSEGRTALTEAESKMLIGLYGVPVVTESIATSERAASARAKRIGFPVVLKGLGANLTHKTDRGLVKLDLRSGSQVRQAFRHIKTLAGADWEGCLIQPQVTGKREFAAGFFRDPQFGPIVMFGLGGILTEALGDTSFRFAPLEKADAEKMIKEISSRKLLLNFRGESAADGELLIRTLLGLSALGLKHPEIMEIDINPLIVAPDGNVTAVDALVILKGPRDEATAEYDRSGEAEDDAPEKGQDVQKAIGRMAHAESIAVMGARRSRPGAMDRGDIFLRICRFGFPGRLYPINPNAEAIRGYRSYPDLSSLPEIPDLVIICLPAKSVPDALKSCRDSGCRNIHIFTSGFAETGEDDGIRLQKEAGQIAREGGLNVIGPNCMGLYVPAAGITTLPSPPKDEGPVAFISQSGGNARDFTTYANNRFGVGFSKVISYGNALTLDCTDFLKYLANDDKTKIIAMYLEGARKGNELLELVRKTSPRKPVVIYKSGLTESGIRAVASHTGALAGDENIWNAFFNQSGAIRAESLEEMTELVLALLNLPACQGRNAAIIGFGGGLSVTAADACSRAGLNLPDFSPDLKNKLRTFIPAAGNIICNPIDAQLIFLNIELFGKALRFISEASCADLFIISLHLDWIYGVTGGEGQYLEKLAEYIASQGKEDAGGKPIVVAYMQYENDPELKRRTEAVRGILLKAGVPVYEGLTRAVSTLAKICKYNDFCRGTNILHASGNYGGAENKENSRCSSGRQS